MQSANLAISVERFRTCFLKAHLIKFPLMASLDRSYTEEVVRAVSLVVQCFAKLDTLDGLFCSLLKCQQTEFVDLVIWIDACEGNPRMEKYREKNELVELLVNKFIADNPGKFRSAQVHRNKVNLGTCGTCKVAVDHALTINDFAILMEDDVILARDVLIWFDTLRNSEAFESEKIWAIAGESIFFNARENKLPDGWQKRMIQVSEELEIFETYVKHNFLPSTCFATSAEKWKDFGHTRGQALGDVDVCIRCKEEDRWAIFPVIPRVKDIGMLHQDGYSVMIHTTNGVSEIKNTYITSDDFEKNISSPPSHYRYFDGDHGKLYMMSTLLQET